MYHSSLVEERLVERPRRRGVGAVLGIALHLGELGEILLRVPSPCQGPRLLLLARDGGARLVPPVSVELHLRPPEEPVVGEDLADARAVADDDRVVGAGLLRSMRVPFWQAYSGNAIGPVIFSLIRKVSS